MDKNRPKGRRNEIVVQELENELLIYDLETNKSFCLNQTSALVWQTCDGTKSVSEISREIGQKLKMPVNENLVWLAIDQLNKNNLLDGNQKTSVKFGGISRREVIKKIALTSMTALPVITSLIAPTAAMGASTCGVVCTCSNTTVGAGAICGVCATIGCTVCRKRNGGNDSRGDCFTA